MIKRLTQTVATALVAFLIVLMPMTSHAQRTTKWTINWSVSPHHSWSLALQEWAELVTEMTNGQMQFDIFYYDALGTQKETLENMRLGIMHGTYALETLSFWVDEINIFSVGYLFADEDHMIRALNSEVGQIIEDRLIAAGFRPLMYFIRAPRNITSNRPIESLSDLAGLTVRVPEAPANVRLFEAMGAKATTLPFSEVIPALQTGVIDAQENPLDLLVDFKLWEVQKYVAVTEHQRQAIYFVVAERAYQQLSDEVKEIMHKAAEIAQRNEYARFKQQEQEWKSILEENGMIFTYPDQSEFREAVRDAFSDFGEPIVSLIEKVRELE